MLNFFVELVNSIGIPIVLIGTREGLQPISQAFCNARRGTGEGDKNWLPMLNDDEWSKLISAIWNYQWTKEECPLTQQISDVLYQESFGITDIAVKLFIIAQWRAISTGREKISPQMIKSVAKDSLNLVRPALELMKKGDYNTILTNYPDVFLSQDRMAEIKKEHFLRQEKRNKKSNVVQDLVEKEKIISNIASWLIQAGFSSEKSENSAKQAINLFGETKDIQTLRKEAFNIVITLNDNITNNIPADKPKNNKKPVPKSELVLHLEEAKEQGKDVSVLLKRNGYIKDPNEFV